MPRRRLLDATPIMLMAYISRSSRANDEWEASLYRLDASAQSPSSAVSVASWLTTCSHSRVLPMLSASHDARDSPAAAFRQLPHCM